nr:uncharacterized protein LOC109168056 [Ipomoea trifida]
MSPIEFQRLLEKLTDAQRKAAEDIRFGSLLRFKLSCWDKKLAKYLVSNFDIYRCALKFQDEETLIAENMENTLGLPRGQLEIVEGNNSNAIEEYNNLLDEWRGRWNLQKCSPLVKDTKKEHMEGMQR